MFKWVLEVSPHAGDRWARTVNMKIDGVFHESYLLIPLLDLDKVSLFIRENISIALVFFSI